MKPSLAGVPQFVRYLSAFPPADRVVEAAVRGPLAHVGAPTLFLWQVRGSTLTAVGAYGHTPEEIGRYGTIPLGVEGLSALAVRTQEVVVRDMTALERTPLSHIDDDMLSRHNARLGVRYAVNVPIIHAGTAVGAYGFAVAEVWDPDGHGPAIIEAVASALAIWMTHPRSEVSRAGMLGAPDWSLAFTPRQRDVLRLVEIGMSTPAIAVSLAVSESSIKADLQRAMRALRTSDRREAARRARALGLL